MVQINLPKNSKVQTGEYYKDKTNWREMLKNNKTDIDLENERLECLKNLPNEVLKYISKEKRRFYRIVL